MPLLYPTKHNGVHNTSDGYVVTSKQLDEQYKLRRQTKFDKTGCAKCWSSCRCDYPQLP
jgi:hypothetical protein